MWTSFNNTNPQIQNGQNPPPNCDLFGNQIMIAPINQGQSFQSQNFSNSGTLFSNSLSRANPFESSKQEQGFQSQNSFNSESLFSTNPYSGSGFGSQHPGTLQETSESTQKPDLNNEVGIAAEFKLVIIGDGGVGKSSFIRNLQNLSFESYYNPTVGKEVIPLTFSTKYGPIKLSVWDCAGQERYGGLIEGYFIYANCGVIMFDVTSEESYKNVAKWHCDLVRVCGDIPIVIVGNKVDLTEQRKVEEKSITFPKDNIIEYYEVSTKTNYQMEKPILHILRRLTGDEDLELLDSAQAKQPNNKVNQRAEESTFRFDNEDEEEDEEFR